MAEHYVYWISTSLVSLLYLASATMYVVKREWARQALAELGYPGHLVPTLIAVKLLAVAAILSRWNAGLSDLAYAGMFFHLLLAALAHISARKPKNAVPAIVGVTLLVASFLTQNAARENPSPYLLAAVEHRIGPMETA